ncbi:uncharacterized protein DUF4352 [Thermosporothrix hazakensis]|jgi:hypothetical protein|uniref:Uncharacterized protein DUF4352 n=2 Tax=Thermosporothrix TaxID=768650 RepID=A0A326U2A0_THEHA|nr:DUF4352 domain-containing protein [Thermosporothrix hazakensis]PZW25399.1 uncharacterized protein DUF4352 [Thermosporothrix hazakensis]BBH90733.1 hypothetical protein KTC_54840 [Thermosporothrix sp. COM3]GCE48783.1 hypothetical protein KTH_36520 [Thermosporothrix hazakensis]
MKRTFVALFSLLILVGALLACGASNENTGTAAPPSNDNKETATKETTKKDTETTDTHFKKGELVKVGNTWEITVNSVATNEGSEYLKPKDGKIFLVVNVSMHNISDKEQNVSSILNFNLKDSNGQKANPGLLDSANPAPDGKVEASGKLAGDLVYEVPASEKNFTLSFQSDLLSTGQTLWDLSL